MDNIKQVVKDVRFLIATDCCDETIQSRIENFINEREQALRIQDVVGQSEQLVCDCGSKDIKGTDYGFFKCNDCKNEWDLAN